MTLSREELIDQAGKVIWVADLPERNRDWGERVWGAPNMRDDPARIRALAQADAALAVFEQEQMTDRTEELAARIGRGVVAVQNGEPEHVILAMLRGEARYDYNTVVFEQATTPTDPTWPRTNDYFTPPLTNGQMEQVQQCINDALRAAAIQEGENR